MSLSWRDRVHLKLSAESWSLRRSPGLWPRRSAPPVGGVCTAADGDEPWRPAVAAATAALAEAQWANAALEVIVADSLLRYRVLTWQPGLAGDDEEIAYARLKFREIYGPLAETWEIRLADAPPGESRIACAMDSALMGALMALRGARPPEAVRPAFVYAFNRLRRRLGGPLSALLLAEGGHATLGVLQGGRWLTLSGRRIEGPASEALPSLLAREALRGGWPATGGTGLVVGAQTPPNGSIAGWQWQAADSAP